MLKNSGLFSILMALATLLAIVFLPACSGTYLMPDGSAAAPPDIALDSAVVAPLTLAQTAEGLAGALAGTNSPLIYQSENLVLISWKVGNITRAFTVFGKSGQPIADIVNQLSGGQAVTVKTFDNLKDFLLLKGWNQIPASALPATLLAALNNYIQSAIAGVANFNPTILVLPLVTEDALDYVRTPEPVMQ